MNLLPFTVIFILIISLSSLALFQGHANTVLSNTLFSAFMKAHVEARNQVEMDNFATHVEKEPRKEGNKNKPAKPRDNKPYVSFRTRITDNSKFNMAALFKENSILLQETMARLIAELYGFTSFFKEQKNPKLSELLTRELLKAAPEIPLESLDFTKIVIKNEALNMIWYKMLRGTAEYDLATHEGWPPFDHYVMFRSNEPKAVCLRKASIPLLKSFLGEKATLKILECEEQKYYDHPGKPSYLSKEEFESILNECSLTDRAPFFTHQYGNTKNEELVKIKDKDSGIVASIKHPNPDNK